MSSGSMMKPLNNLRGFLHLLDWGKNPEPHRTTFKTSGVVGPHWQSSHVSPQHSGSSHQNPNGFSSSSPPGSPDDNGSRHTSPEVVCSQEVSGSDPPSADGSSAGKDPKKQGFSINAFVRSWWTEHVPRRKPRADQDPGENHGTPESPLDTSQSSSDTSVSESPDFLQCPLCLSRRRREDFPKISTCPHRSCLVCLREYLRVEILESRINIKCPECFECLCPQDIRTILQDQDLVGKYEEFMLRRFLAAEPDCRWCPAPDCGYAVLAHGCAVCPKLSCARRGCNTDFCYHCKQRWHPDKTCDAARQDGEQNFELRVPRSSLSSSQDSGGDETKQCPRCSAFIDKADDWGCNHMVCVLCGCEFCWLCMREISDLHYLSPSGCTFWGKKTWSQKKKILSLLSTMLGAPVAIALFASLAVPSMIVGIPVYVGRKVVGHYRCKRVSRYKKSLIVAGGVSLSVVASPVIAVLSVAAGVPLLLAYVYGVIPVSLVRTGVFRVPSVSSRGVRIRFDEDSDSSVFRAAVAAAEAQPYIPDLRQAAASVFGPPGLGSGAGHVECCGPSSGHLSITPAGGSSSGNSHYHRLQLQTDVKKEACDVKIESTTDATLGTIADGVSSTVAAGSLLLDACSALESLFPEGRGRNSA